MKKINPQNKIFRKITKDLKPIFVIAWILVFVGLSFFTDVNQAQATTSGDVRLYLHKEPSADNATYNSLSVNPPEPAVRTVSGAPATNTFNPAAPALCESSTNTGEAINGTLVLNTTAHEGCIASFISPQVGQAITISVGDTAPTPLIYGVDSATGVAGTWKIYLYKWNGTTLTLFNTLSSTFDTAATAKSITGWTASAYIATTFAATDRIVAIATKVFTSATAGGTSSLLFDSTGAAAASFGPSYINLPYTIVTPNQPALTGSKDDDFISGVVTTACSTVGVIFNTKWTCLQGTAASTAGELNDGNPAGTVGDSTEWLWLNNKRTIATAVASNFGTTSSNTFLYQPLSSGYGDGTVRTVVSTTMDYTVGVTNPVTPFSHSGLVLWTSNTDYIEVQVHSSGLKSSINTAFVALNNCTTACTGNNGTLTSVSLNPALTTGTYNRVWLGFLKTGTSYQAQYSIDGTTWINIGTAVVHATEFSRVGLNSLSKFLGTVISAHSGAFGWFQYLFAVGLPTVTTQAVSSITLNTATGNGNITSTGSVNNDFRGVVYDTVTHALPGNVAPASSLYALKVEEAGSFAAGAFTESITGLTGSTTYYVRAYSHNSTGYSYGGEVSFTTLATTTTLGNGTDGGNSTIAPGALPTEVDRFSLSTNSGTDTVTNMTVTLAGGANAYQNIEKLEVRSTGFTQQTASGSRNWQSITSSSDGTKLAAVEISTGYIYTSTDSGVTWTQTSAGPYSWSGITSSSDGTKLAAVEISTGYIYTSTDSGATWTQQTSSGSHAWYSITSSSDGTKLAAADGTFYSSGYIYTSTDSGATWTQQTSAGLRNWYGITSSSDGTKLAAVEISTGDIYTSTDSGATWTQQTSAGPHYWSSITSSSNGTKLATVDGMGGYIYTSTDSGATWTQQTSSGLRNWHSIASSSDGTKLAAVDDIGYIYTSTDSGATWTQQTSSGSHAWYSITSSSDGTKLAAVDSSGYIYTTDSVLCSLSPTSNTVNLTGCNIPVSTTAIDYRILITPKTHATMPAVPGASYATTATVTSITTTNAKTGTDTGSATITIDNLSPNSVTSTSGTAGTGKVTLNWTASNSTDISNSVILRWTGGTPGAEVPVEGATYIANNTITSATVACVLTSTTSQSHTSIVDGTGGTVGCNTTALLDGQAYSYKIFQKDINGNHSVGLTFTGSPFTTTSLSTTTPTIVLNTADATNFGGNTTPTLEMTATDPNGDDVLYNVQISSATSSTNRWVATGSGANPIAYSDDGTTWTGVGSGLHSIGYGVAYNGTMWVSVGSGTNKAAYSSDGINWTGSASANALLSSDGSGVAWNGSIWVIVGTGTANSIIYSSDGMNWLAATNSKAIFSSYGQRVAWNGSMWVAVGVGANAIATSTDGINWTGRGFGALSIQGNGIAWNGSMWVAVGDGTNKIATSSDGINWTGITGSTIFVNSGRGVAWNGSMWVAVGNDTTDSIAYSSNGTTWTKTSGLTIFSNYGYGVAWNGTMWVAVGKGATHTIATSTDGINWTGRGNTAFSSYGYDIASSTPVSMVPSITSSTLLLDKVSSGDSGFLNTVSGGDLSPFTSANKVSYTVQPVDALATGTYSWRARAVDPLGTNVYSEWTTARSFIISVVITLPTVTTQAVSSVTATTATGNGNITNTGGATNDFRGVVYDTVTHALPGNVAPASSLYALKVEEAGSFAAGAFTENITGLTGSTTYYVRAYSHNSAGYSYGGEVSFIATAGLLSVSGTLTSSVFNTTANSTSIGYNSMMWKGTLGADSTGKVRFQLSASNCTNGATDFPACVSVSKWPFYGGDTCQVGDWFSTTGPNAPVELKGTSCISNWNNKRYFRYKVQVCSNDCVTAGSYTPVVNKVIVNWSS